MPTTIASAVCTFQVQPGGSVVQLFPSGQFRAADGRPHELPAWWIDASTAANLIRRASNRQTPFVIDYEHQTLHTEKNGQPAPAAGWFPAIEWRSGGLFATDVTWTHKAKAMIAAGEYRFISPVFTYSQATGEIQELLHAGLTNVPAIDGMDQLRLEAARAGIPAILTAAELRVCELFGHRPADFLRTKILSKEY